MERKQRASAAAAAAVLLVLLLAQSAVEGKCMVKNQSAQPMAIVPVGAAVGVEVEVEVDVGVEVEVEDSQQNCYIKNKHSGNTKGPVMLQNDGIYVFIDAAVEGEVNLCVGSVSLLGVLKVGVVIVGSI